MVAPRVLENKEVLKLSAVVNSIKMVSPAVAVTLGVTVN